MKLSMIAAGCESVSATAVNHQFFGHFMQPGRRCTGIAHLRGTGTARMTYLSDMGQAQPTQSPPSRLRARRLGDVVVASVLVVVTLPLMMIVAIAIKCDSRGPIFSREERLDRQGGRFFALKFRSTLQEDPPIRDCGASVSFVGRIIRFLWIDNLPQLVNVLRGEMTCFAGDPNQLFFLE
jgi:lipopolysaccharide/colanic/teichoic acid biosynthesis glycosyltransferase